MNVQESRVAVVTGGARGIGDAIAEAFLEEGTRVVVLDKVLPEDRRDGVRYVEADVSDPASVAAAFETIDANEARVDVLVNNAGIQRAGLIGRISFEDWANVIGTHLTGTFNCCSQAVPRMIAGGRGGAIVSIASVAGFLGLPGRGPYCAAKAGIMGLTRALATEVAELGITVNAVAPGFTRTELLQQALDDGSLTEGWMTQNVPQRRVGSPQEIAHAVRWLASDAAAFITGQSLPVDGGWTIQGISAAPEWLAPTS
jgi:3-oxoacyl-[acyl-carrier protein] reductase